MKTNTGLAAILTIALSGSYAYAAPWHMNIDNIPTIGPKWSPKITNPTTRVEYAIAQGDPDVVGKIHKIFHKNKLLAIAAGNGRSSIVEFMLEKDYGNPFSNPYFVTGYRQETPISIAAQEGNAKSLQAMLDYAQENDLLSDHQAELQHAMDKVQSKLAKRLSIVNPRSINLSRVKSILQPLIQPEEEEEEEKEESEATTPDTRSSIKAAVAKPVTMVAKPAKAVARKAKACADVLLLGAIIVMDA